MQWLGHGMSNILHDVHVALPARNRKAGMCCGTAAGNLEPLFLKPVCIPSNMDVHVDVVSAVATVHPQVLQHRTIHLVM
jgi:hypothetical protein